MLSSGDGGWLNHTCEGTADTLIVKKTANTDCAKLLNTVLEGSTSSWIFLSSSVIMACR